MKVDSTLGIDQKAQVLLAILATRDLKLDLADASLQTRAYYDGNRGWVSLRLLHTKGFVKQLTFGRDINTDQFRIQTWDVTVGEPEEESLGVVLISDSRVFEAVEFILRQLREACDVMQSGPAPTRMELLLRD